MLGNIVVGQVWGFCPYHTLPHKYNHTYVDKYVRTYIRAYIYTYKNAYIHAYVTKSTEKRSSWEADRYPTSQESPSTQLSETGSSLSCSNIPPLGTNLSQLNPVIIFSSLSGSNLICSYTYISKIPTCLLFVLPTFFYINIFVKHIYL